MELLTAVAIVGITAAFAVPQYQKTMERSYYRAAQDILQAIYTGERFYYSRQNPNAYLGGLSTGSGNWGVIFMDDPNIGSPLPVTFRVDGGGASFTATATRIGGPCPERTLTIDQNRAFTGNWPSSGVC
ncbi:MAG: hypothetical protein HYY58_00605 [Candidatus Omnitrophica bacterium]|nr:hypothetical protein [Candidatus Omnitrophota bacterium]